MPSTRIPFAVALLAVALAAACARPPSQLVEQSRQSMGSLLTVRVWATDRAAAESAVASVFGEFDRLEALLSVWRSQSDVVRLNAAAGDHPVRVSQDTIDVLAAAREAGDWTNGKFDITFGALAEIWKFDHDQDNTVPDRAAIDARVPLVDYRFVEVDRAAGTAFISRRGARVHLGGIGKGYAIERAVAMLRERGFGHFLIQAGGDLYVAGRDGDQRWTLGINDPRGPAGRVFATVDISDATLSTSGDYERFFMKDGIRYHHLIDPDLGEPARGCRSVTIVTNRPTLADVLSTGVFIMGPADGMALIETLPDVEGVIVTATNEVLISSGLKGRVALVASPTDAP